MPFDDNFTGTIEEDTGGGKIVVPYKNGQKQGIARYISETGEVLSEIEYQDDEINGIVMHYYRSCKKLSHMEYKNGKPNGIAITFYENGMIQMKAEYKNGSLHGKYEIYDEFGDTIETCTYCEGAKHGIDTIYYPKSQGGGVYEISTYMNGMLQGERTSFQPNGTPMTTTPFKNGRAQTYPKSLNSAFK